MGRLEKHSDRPDRPAVRASDGDRDRVADILREALAEGRLDAEEHGERIDAVYRAKTVPELEVLVRDLPAGQQPGTAPRAAPPAGPAGPARSNVVAVLSGAVRQGAWRVGASVNAVAICGGIELDFTEAVFEHREVTVNTTALCGGIDIKVPENVTVRNEGTGIMGGFDIREQRAEDPDAPVIVIRGLAFWGGVACKRARGKRLRDLREGGPA